MENKNVNENNEMVPVVEASGLWKGMLVAIAIEAVAFGALVGVGYLLSFL